MLFRNLLLFHHLPPLKVNLVLHYRLPALPIGQSTIVVTVPLWQGAPVALSCVVGSLLFFIVYLVFTPEIFIQGPSFVLAPIIAVRTAMFNLY